MQLTPSFRSLLLPFRSVFTAPTFATFLYIATGWCPESSPVWCTPDGGLGDGVEHSVTTLPHSI